MMPYWSENDRRRDAPADATQRLYHLSAPLRLSRNGRPSLSPDGSEEPLTRDVQEVLTSLQDLASHPRLRCLLYGNKVLQHYGRQESNREDTSMIFEKNSLTYKQVPRGDPEDKGINETLLSSNLDPQASSDQKTTQILLQTSTDISPQR